MASPASGGTSTIPSRRSRLIRCIAIILLASIVLVGLTILIIWLAVKPKLFIYTVEDGSIHDFDLKKDHLNATFHFILRSYNPNSKVSVYYDSIEVSVSYDDQTIAFDVVDPFFQPHRNVTRLKVKPVARSMPLLESVSKDLRLEKSTGDIELGVQVKARVRFKVGMWKSSERTLRVLCSPVVVHISSLKNFDRTYCDIYL